MMSSNDVRERLRMAQSDLRGAYDALVRAQQTIQHLEAEHDDLAAQKLCIGLDWGFSLIATSVQQLKSEIDAELVQSEGGQNARV